MPEPKDADQRLDELGKTIDAAREHAGDAIPVLDEDERRYYESGEIKPDEDDQTITP